MSDTVIRAEGLGKRYRRGLTGPPETLRDALTRVIKSPLAAMRPQPGIFLGAARRRTFNPFWRFSSETPAIAKSLTFKEMGERRRAKPGHILPEIANLSDPERRMGTTIGLIRISWKNKSTSSIPTQTGPCAIELDSKWGLGKPRLMLWCIPPFLLAHTPWRTY